MIDALIGNVRGILTRPLETFRAVRDEDTRAVFRYFLALLLADAVFTAIVSLSGAGTFGLLWRVLRVRHPVLVFFLVLVGGLILVPLFSAWLHLWVRLVGGKNGFSRTLSAVMYGATPALLFGWIPFIGILFYFWAMVLVIFGLYAIQEIEGERAAFAVIVAVIIPLVLLVLLVAWLLFSSPAMTVTTGRAVFL
ncbi:Yip1 family protein [Methanoregula sp.]|uniref:Yip1 family protein n=1 Tax=Methanoregula sp. TaxID=2052170 RepID=UPI002C459EBE|nr:Yip1 family protein [Methanoregula sp.]HVP96040.1 Yip1 family protein [Methanoregula sp.]